MQVFGQVLERISSLPGVTSTGAATQLPLRGDTFNLGRGYVREGDPATSASEGNANFLTVTPTYFDTMQIPLKAGRRFTERDTNDKDKVVIVNETLARKLWPGESPVGRKIWVWHDEKFHREIVGVVGNVQQAGSGWGNFGPIAPVPCIYIPVSQTTSAFLALVHTWFEPSWAVRSTLPTLAPRIRDAIESVDPELSIARGCTSCRSARRCASFWTWRVRHRRKRSSSGAPPELWRVGLLAAVR